MLHFLFLSICRFRFFFSSFDAILLTFLNASGFVQDSNFDTYHALLAFFHLMYSMRFGIEISLHCDQFLRFTTAVPYFPLIISICQLYIWWLARLSWHEFFPIELVLSYSFDVFECLPNLFIVILMWLWDTKSH